MLCHLPAGTMIAKSSPASRTKSSRSHLYPAAAALHAQELVYAVVTLQPHLAACRDRHQRKLQVAARPQRRAEVVVGQRIPLDIYHGRLGAEIPQLDNRSVVRDDGSPLLRTAAGSHNRSRRSKTDNHLLHSKTFLAVIRIVTPFKHISCP